MRTLCIHWLFDDMITAKEAMKEACENKETACSLGVGDKQHIGFDFSEGSILYNEYWVDGECFAHAEWQALADGLEKDTWFSPYLFEEVDTFGLDGTSMKGEAYTFEMKEKESYV